MGPIWLSYIGVPDGRQCDFGPYTPPKGAPKGGPKGPIWDPLLEPFWPGALKKGVDLKPVKLGQPRGLAGTAQKGVSECTPLEGPDSPFWGPI